MLIKYNYTIKDDPSVSDNKKVSDIKTNMHSNMLVYLIIIIKY